MKWWPWVSRARLDEKVELLKTMVRREMLDDAHRQIEWLKEELSKALEKRDRIDRVEAGMPENHREPPPKREPMPQELKEYINAFGHTGMKRQMRSSAYKRHADGEPWAKIVEDVVIPEPPREIFLQVEGFDEEEEPEAGGSEAVAVRGEPGSDEPGARSEGR